MERRCVLSGSVRGGRLRVRGWKGLELWHDGEVTITIQRQRATRSPLQNAYYWGVVLRHLAEHTGYTIDEMHAYCKVRFNPERLVVCDRDGVVKDERRIGLTTTDLNKVTFGEYLETIRQWAAADLGVVIPDPVEDWRQPAAPRSSVA